MIKTLPNPTQVLHPYDHMKCSAMKVQCLLALKQPGPCSERAEVDAEGGGGCDGDPAGAGLDQRGHRGREDPGSISHLPGKRSTVEFCATSGASLRR